MKRIPLLFLLAASAATLVAIPSWWLSSRPDSSAGSLEGLSLEAPVGATVTPQPWLGLPLTAPEPRAALRVRRARVADLPRRKQLVPVSLRIPALEVEAPVVPVGVDRETREMELPPDNATAAWYRYGASPGGEGSAVIAGHVDYGEGRAVFFRLAELEPGNRMTVGYGDGSKTVFRVVARRLVGKDELPPRIFSTRGRPLLTLVTCGGTYDAARRQYLGNTLVFAVPV
jgi:LPXTG-site transpeptidase (sortase) family protein